jgi:surface antigen
VPPPAVAASLPIPTLSSREAADETLVADLAGNDLARMLDPVDRRQLREALQRTLETSVSGHVNGWRNEFSRNGGTIVASPAFKNPAGQWCRKLVQTITISRETRSGNGTACRSTEGRWDLVP